MKINRLIYAASATGVALFMMAASVNAGTISNVTFNTNAAGTQFVSPTSGLSISNATGLVATLTFTPDGDLTVGPSTNINYGKFSLVCTLCTTSTDPTPLGSFFDPFTFDLIVTDKSDVATGLFVGSSSGGEVFSDVSPITINWVPIILGPGATNAATGDFGTTTFNINPTSRIVAPNSGATPGETTVQGTLATTAAPEPASMALIGGGLLVIGLFGRKKLSRR